jgi:hypothetical protein
MSRVQHAIPRLGVIAGLMIGTLWVQDALSKPATHPQLVRVRIGNSCGWCTQGYNDNATIVEPQRIASINRAYSNKKKHPDLVSESKIIKRVWKDLQDLIEDKVMGVFANAPKGCPGCTDEPTASTELLFSGGGEPASMLEMRQKIGEIGKNLWLRDTRRQSHYNDSSACFSA